MLHNKIKNIWSREIRAYFSQKENFSMLPVKYIKLQ